MGVDEILVCEACGSSLTQTEAVRQALGNRIIVDQRCPECGTCGSVILPLHEGHEVRIRDQRARAEIAELADKLEVEANRKD